MYTQTWIPGFCSRFEMDKFVLICRQQMCLSDCPRRASQCGNAIDRKEKMWWDGCRQELMCLRIALIKMGGERLFGLVGSMRLGRVQVLCRLLVAHPTKDFLRTTWQHPHHLCLRSIPRCPWPVQSTHCYPLSRLAVQSAYRSCPVWSDTDKFSFCPLACKLCLCTVTAWSAGVSEGGASYICSGHTKNSKKHKISKPADKMHNFKKWKLSL